MPAHTSLGGRQQRNKGGGTVLDPLSSLSKWERWALETWLESVRFADPREIRWSDLPPAQYARALGELATRMGIRLPRRQYGRVEERKQFSHVRIPAPSSSVR